MKEAFHIRVMVGPRGRHGTLTIIVYLPNEATRWFDALFALIPEEQRHGTTISISHRDPKGTWHAIKTIPWSEFQGIEEVPP